jgi:uncharacterized protein YbbK (DUF523 family)
VSDAANPAGGEKVLVSACLLGRSCTYEGKHNGDGELARALEDGGLEAVPFCPEEHGGLGTPRPPADLTASAEDVLDGRGAVVTHRGEDVTEGFRRGAEGALEACARLGIRRAFLKERSPSCGCAATHVAGEVVPGPGLTAALLRRNGIECEGVEGRRD